MRHLVFILLLCCLAGPLLAQSYNVPFRRRAAAPASAAVMGHSSFTAATTGTQSFTITWSDGGSHTPTAALFFATWATASGTFTQHSSASIGCATGASERWVTSTIAEDNLSTTDTNYSSATDEVIQILDPVNTDVEGEADFSSFSSNTVSVAWGAAPTQAALVYVVAFSETDGAVCGTYDPADGAAGTVDVTALGATANVVFSSASYYFDDTIRAGSGVSIGWYSYDGATTTQAGMMVSDLDNVTGVRKLHYAQTANAVQLSGNTTWGSGLTGEYLTYANHASGFTVTTNQAIRTEIDVGYLALDLPDDNDHHVEMFLKAGSTGNEAKTTPGFLPESLCMIASTSATVDDEGGLDPDGWSFGCTTGSASQRSLGISGDDAASTSANDSYADADDLASAATSTTPAVRTGGDLVSFDATGYTINWDTATAVYVTVFTLK